METTLYCKKCEDADIDEEDIFVEKETKKYIHNGCGGEVEEVCIHCLGTLEIIEDGIDRDGNIERGVDSRKCPFCKSEDFEE